MGNFLSLTTRVPRNEAAIVGPSNSVKCSSPSRDNFSNEIFSVPVLSGNRNESAHILKLLTGWCVTSNYHKALTSYKKMQIVGIHRNELEIRYDRSLIKQGMNSWNGVVKSQELDIDMLTMVIDASFVRRAWKYLLRMAHEETWTDRL